ncbi:MAG: hypothetical protein M3144_06165 [Actinomycetota bacterium]|nr:hypothetical protein [Actinomycetota bacterium]
MRRWLALTVLVVVGMTSACCTRRPSQAVGRLEVSGRAEVDTADSGKQTVTGSRTLRNGEQVTLVDGTATLNLGSGRQLELRKGTVLRLALLPAATGRTEPRGELVSGDVLVVATGEGATVVAGDTTITVPTGAARVSRDLSLVVAVYEGAASVDSAGSVAAVPALRQVTVPAPGLPSRRTPLAFSPGDSWDQRYLGDAMELGNQLVSRSRGFTGQLSPGDGTTADFYRRILPVLADQPFDDSLVSPDRPPGETLVGAAITVEGTRGEFRNRWESVFSFHDEGAPWGLVALAQGVSSGPLLSTLDAAIGRVPGLSAAPTPPANAPPPTTPPAGGGASSPSQVALPVLPIPSAPAGGGDAGGGTAPDGTATGTHSGTSTGTPAPPSPPRQAGQLPTRGPFDLGIPLVDNTLNTVVDALSGLLRAISSG